MTLPAQLRNMDPAARNRIDAARAFLSDRAEEDIATLGQGCLHAALFGLFDPIRRSKGQDAAEKAMLVFCRVWGWIAPLIWDHGRRFHGWNETLQVDLCAFFMQRVRGMELSRLSLAGLLK